MIAIYARVSSNQQTTRSQEMELKRWATDKEVIWYKDQQTGSNMDRPGFNAMLEDIRSGKVKEVVIWRLDRLGRTARGLLAFIQDELEARKINFISLKDSIDLTTPAGRLLLVVLAGVAQFELEIKTERQRAGIEAAKAAGKTWGGRAKGTRVKVTLEKEEAVKDLVRLKKPISEISRVTGLSRPTIYKITRQTA